jgi:hypothetical protein
MSKRDLTPDFITNDCHRHKAIKTSLYVAGLSIAAVGAYAATKKIKRHIDLHNEFLESEDTDYGDNYNRYNDYDTNGYHSSYKDYDTAEYNTYSKYDFQDTNRDNKNFNGDYHGHHKGHYHGHCHRKNWNTGYNAKPDLSDRFKNYTFKDNTFFPDEKTTSSNNNFSSEKNNSKGNNGFRESDFYVENNFKNNSPVSSVNHYSKQHNASDSSFNYSDKANNSSTIKYNSNNIHNNYDKNKNYSSKSYAYENEHNINGLDRKDFDAHHNDVYYTFNESPVRNDKHSSVDSKYSGVEFKGNNTNKSELKNKVEEFNKEHKI